MLPLSPKLPVHLLAGSFKDVTATYKYFWLLSIVKLHSRNPERLRFSGKEIVCRMISEAFCPLCTFRLSFGRMDSLEKIIKELQSQDNLFYQELFKGSTDAIEAKLLELKGMKLFKPALKLLRYVPYRFLNPWLDLKSSAKPPEVIERSAIKKDCLYRIIPTQEGIDVEINREWSEYLLQHEKIIREFILWNLAQFLSDRNPNTPNIVAKLMRPEQRSSLALQHEYWKSFLEANGPIPHLYFRNRFISADDPYALDHFLPWNFVAHNLIWNLYPLDQSTNSSKSDRLPSLLYLDTLASIQQKALRFHLSQKTHKKLTEEFYWMSKRPPQELAEMHPHDFFALYEDVYSPMHGNAKSLGFLEWNVENSDC